MKLPDAIFDQHIAVLGKTRSGKSSVLRFFVEDLLERDKPVCVVDPKGDWWGLKSSANGKHAGYPVIIFGGEHADVPINAHAGAHIAELVATGNRPCIIDLGGWMVGERTRFFIDFASGLFRHTKGHRWLVIDEVHNFAPQGKVLDPDAGKMLHWSNRLASEGLGKGLAIMSASQRPQKVHKDFLTCSETLIAMRVIHPLDRGAIKDWIDGCPDAEKGKEVLAGLASMPRGEGWVWSPEIGFGPKRIAFPMFKTYDSFRSRGDEATTKLKGWAEVDLDDVRAKMAETIEKARANDPAELKRRIAELEKQARGQKPVAVTAPKVEIKEVHVLKDSQVKRTEALADKLSAHGDKCLREAGELRKAIGLAIRPMPPIVKHARPTLRIPAPPMRQGRSEFNRNNQGPQSDNGSIGKGAVRVLTAVAQHAEGVTREQATILTGYKRSTRDAYLQRLGVAGYVEVSGDRVLATESGIALLGSAFEPLPTGAALLEYWMNRLPAGERIVLAAVCAVYPRSLDRDQITETTGYKRSTRDAYIQRLTTRRLVSAERGIVTAASALFEE